MSCLYRADDDAMPSSPVAVLMVTVAGFATGPSTIPPMKVFVWLAPPIRVTCDSLAAPPLPM